MNARELGRRPAGHAGAPNVKRFSQRQHAIPTSHDAPPRFSEGSLPPGADLVAEGSPLLVSQAGMKLTRPLGLGFLATGLSPSTTQLLAKGFPRTWLAPPSGCLDCRLHLDVSCRCQR